MKYAFVITYTDCPGDVTNAVQDVYVLDLTEEAMNELSHDIQEKFREAGDGNDVWYDLEVEPVIDCDAISLREIANLLVPSEDS